MMSASTASGRYILLAGPDLVQRQALVMRLQAEGYLVDEASTLDEALAQGG